LESGQEVGDSKVSFLKCRLKAQFCVFLSFVNADALPFCFLSADCTKYDYLTLF